MLNAGEMQSPIVFFDGVCNLCNGFIDWLLRHDTERIFKVASLQGTTAKNKIPKERIDSLSSLVLWDNGALYEKSSAVLMIMRLLPAPWRWLRVLKIVPVFLRDPAYDFIARNRYRFFGKRDLCRLPTPDERERFLD